MRGVSLPRAAALKVRQASPLQFRPLSLNLKRGAGARSRASDDKSRKIKELEPFLIEKVHKLFRKIRSRHARIAAAPHVIAKTA